MIVKLMTEQHLEFLGLKGGFKGSSEFTFVKIPHCWKSHALAQILPRGHSYFTNRNRRNITKGAFLFYQLKQEKYYQGGILILPTETGEILPREHSYFTN